MAPIHINGNVKKEIVPETVQQNMFDRGDADYKKQIKK